jgi:hypothetical protein
MRVVVDTFRIEDLQPFYNHEYTLVPASSDAEICRRAVIMTPTSIIYYPHRCLITCDSSLYLVTVK